MKKVMNIAKILFVISIASLMLTACGSPKVSDDHLRYGQKALSIVDDYLNFNINAKEASEQAKELKYREDSLPKVEIEDETYRNNFNIESSVRMINLYLSSLSLFNSEEDLKNLKIERNKIAEIIGEDLIEVSEADSQ